jgi:KDO2-lipid IV(A) lauroyltransferase
VARNRAQLSYRRLAPLYLAYLVASRLVPRLPRPVGYWLADRAGDLAWCGARAARRAVAGNLTRVTGRKPTRQLVRLVFRHGARNYYDTFLIPTLGPDELRGLVQVEGWSQLEAALAAGKGAIMVGVHLSSVALCGQIVAARGHSITTVTEAADPPDLNEFLLRLRSGGGVRALPLGGDLMRQLLAALRRNEVVGLVMDRDIAGTGVAVDFFGAETRLPGGAALLALRTGAPILPAVAVRARGDRFRGWIANPVDVERVADPGESVRRTTAAIARRFEPYIRAHPEQWTVFQPIWPSQGGLDAGRSA